ncbi:MAG TPA: fructosamine kinase family protein, partial [Pseudonocardiaceae bacterium]|nr:fructosamine kinase family protein [Pseudonocardiaceae bacterium]
MTHPAVVRDAVTAAGLGAVVDARVLAGGDISTAWLVTCCDRAPVVVKTFGRPDDVAPPPPGLYDCEADGLAALRTIGGVRTPDVLAVTGTSIVLERLATAPTDDEPAFWARAGRSLAIMHGVLGPRYGWPSDGWLGRLRQHNTWHDDGYEFFASRRILRWLP